MGAPPSSSNDRDAAAPVRVLYLGGLGRSGTTLIERLMGELPGAVSLGEVVHLWERGVAQGESCGCGEPFLSCSFWAEVGSLAFGGWNNVDLDRFREVRSEVDRTRHVPALARRELSAVMLRRVEAYTDYYVRLYAAVREVSGAAVLIDSSKHASLAFNLQAGRAGDRLDLRVLHVVRDSRGVAQSWAKQVQRPEATDTSDAYMAQWPPGKVAAHWIAENMAFALLSRRGASVMRVQYEEFMADPVAMTRSVAEFAGLSVDDSGMAFLSHDRAVLSANHTASGNPMRFQTGQVVLRRDEGWRSRMATGDRRTVTALTAPLLRHYGYL